jgi:hypothetical protein
MYVIRLTKTGQPRRPGVARKMVADLQNYFCCPAVIGSLSNRYIHFLKMTNAIGSRTVPVSPNRVMESNEKIESTDPRVSGAAVGVSRHAVGGR